MCRSLNDNVDATVHLDRWETPAIFNFLQKHGNIETEEMYRVFNMGIGYVLAVRPTFADSIVAHLKQSGEFAVVIGDVTKGSGKVHLKGMKTT